MSELHGLLSRLWADLVARPGGPLEFRRLLQPLVAALLAVRDGMSDARTGRPPYFWTPVHDPALLLGFVPHLLIRGPADRVARRRSGGSHGEADQTEHPRHLGR